MKKAVLLYGLCGGILIAALKVAEYRFLVVEHSIELYGGLIALVHGCTRMNTDKRPISRGDAEGAEKTTKEAAARLLRRAALRAVGGHAIRKDKQR